MVRPVSSDFLHSMRFHVAIVDGDQDFLVPQNAEANWPGNSEGGFTSCTIPELSVEPVEYKEGTFIFPRKYPGNPTVSDVSLQRGVTRTDSSFWYWCQASATGGDYRVDLNILHFHRDNTFVGGGITAFDAKLPPGKIYALHEAFPTRCKPAGDMDATASEISLQELDIALEYFEVLDGAGNAIPPMT